MEDLIKNTRSGDPAAFAMLSERYEPLILSMTAKLLPLCDGSVDAEDFRQEALIALYTAAVNYREQGEVTFGLYAKICIRNRLISMIRSHRADRDADRFLPEGLRPDPETSWIERESYRELEKRIKETLTDFEQRVLALYLQKKSYEAIASQLGVSVKSVDNAIYRLKTKLKRLYDRL